ncbi:tetratricopeptide repeat protein [Ferruginibacter sp. SUN002]|uniref:tetratricopeptide repeat protein n=1 Tax=Ferruginibacter sp. SUN002 TaxID=2937789 RepID=UPI003D35EAB4
MITKKIFSLLFITFVFSSAFSQATHTIIDPEKDFKDAKDLFIKKQYGLAYPLLKELHQKYSENQKSNNIQLYEDINYYYTVCELKLQMPIGVDDAKHYLETIDNEPRRQILSYHLAKYYFVKEDFENTVLYYEKAGIANLSNEEIADAKFEQAYSYFNLKKFRDAQPLFDEIRQLPESKYYMRANYYYGFISYYNRQYNEALKSFRIVENEDDYKRVVPYYIAEIYYFQKKKDEALKYGEAVMSKGRLYYEKEMKQLLGQIYFEKKDFEKALPLLEYYVTNSQNVSKEDLYEISYCYYQMNNLPKAIEGFKQLTNQKDSLGQNSMYLLGDCYLRTNQKAEARNAFQFCAYNNSNKTQQEVSTFIYAKLSYELGYQDIALNEMRKFITLYPKSVYNTEAKEILVNILANTNNFSDGLALYESFDKPTPNMQKAYPRILYGKAVEYINDQQLDKADELLGKILQLPASTVTPYANFWRGEIAYRFSKFDDAIRYLTAYLQANVAAQGEANTTSARYNMAYSYFKKENYKQALVYFDQIVKSVSGGFMPLEQDAYIRSADCYYMTKDYNSANTLYTNAINGKFLQSDYATFQLAMIAGIKSSPDKIKTLVNLTRLYPQSSLVADANMEIANTYMADEDFKAAIPFLNTLLTNSNASGLLPKVYLKLGLCNYNINNYKEALNNYQLLVQKYPASPEVDEALESVKNIYVEEGRPNDYVEFMRKSGRSISVSEADELTYNAAELKYNNNDYNGAIEAFGNYLSRFPSGAYALSANFYMSECYTKNKDWNSALNGYNYVITKGVGKYFEKAALTAAQINYFELKDYASAQKNFEALRAGASSQDNQLEATRGLVRCYYQLKDYAQANVSAKELLTKKSISTDDKSIAYLVLGKSQQVNGDCVAAIASFKSCAAINKSAWGAEARYEIANCQFTSGNLTAAEKSAMVVIKETGGYDYWVTRSYILLGDIFMHNKDYFNAKATYQSVAQNATIPELKTEAQQKLDKVVAEEKIGSKLIN